MRYLPALLIASFLGVTGIATAGGSRQLTLIAAAHAADRYAGVFAETDAVDDSGDEPGPTPSYAVDQCERLTATRAVCDVSFTYPDDVCDMTVAVRLNVRGKLRVTNRNDWVCDSYGDPDSQ